MSVKCATSVSPAVAITALILTKLVSVLRRKLKADISAAFPSLTADELSELVPNKEELNVVKIYAHKGDAVTLYVLNKNPLFFELEKQLYPTGETLTVLINRSTPSGFEQTVSAVFCHVFQCTCFGITLISFQNLGHGLLWFRS